MANTLVYTKGDYVEWVGPCEVSINGVDTGKYTIPSKNLYIFEGDPVGMPSSHIYLGRDLNILEDPKVWNVDDSNMYFDDEADALKTHIKYLEQYKASLTLQSQPLFDD
jgi:hypothetical protein